jgi:ribosomal protein L40E
MPVEIMAISVTTSVDGDYGRCGSDKLRTIASNANTGRGWKFTTSCLAAEISAKTNESGSRERKRGEPKNCRKCGSKLSHPKIIEKLVSSLISLISKPRLMDFCVVYACENPRNF